MKRSGARALIIVLMCILSIFLYTGTAHAQAESEEPSLAPGIALTTVGGLCAVAGIGVGIVALSFLPGLDGAAMLGFPALIALALSVPFLISGALLLVEVLRARSADPDASAGERMELTIGQSAPAGFAWRF